MSGRPIRGTAAMVSRGLAPHGPIVPDPKVVLHPNEDDYLKMVRLPWAELSRSNRKLEAGFIWVGPGGLHNRGSNGVRAGFLSECPGGGGTELLGPCLDNLGPFVTILDHVLTIVGGF